jgi:hypothetical protein
MIKAAQAEAAARALAQSALGRDPGRLEKVESQSHYVFMGAAIVVKVIDAGGHSRLDREIALGPDLPPGLSAPVLASGRQTTEAGDIRYACVARLPGRSPGMGLAGVDRETARRWAKQAVEKLQQLHAWSPGPPAAAVLREHLDHGGFVGRTDLQKVISTLTVDVISPAVLDGLTAIADRAPDHAGATVPVHADCHWGNWLVHQDKVTALLDFEWARFGEPADDWMFLSRFSGSHRQTVLAVIAEATGTPLSTLRAACEVREAAYLTSDLLLALDDRHTHRDEAQAIVHDLRTMAVDRSWWQAPE